MEAEWTLLGEPLNLPLDGTLFSGRVRFLPEAGSTNDLIAQAASKGEPEGLCYVAARQRRGRGRQGRRWESDEGGLFLSVLFRPHANSGKISRLSLVAGLSVCRFVGALGVSKARIKWPNDVTVQGNKLAGILSESKLAGDKVESVICGIGLNVNQNPTDLPPASTSLKAEAGSSLSVQSCAAGILRELHRWYRSWQDGAFEKVLIRYQELAVGLQGTRVRVSNGTEEKEGMTDGIDNEGALWVIHNDGSRQIYLAGEVTFLDPAIKAWS
ncbi:biotin--[acetyl-CoA-carboxylase] ligase [Acidobacteriota bacterium]